MNTTLYQRETSPAAKSERKRMFSQPKQLVDQKKQNRLNGPNHELPKKDQQAQAQEIRNVSEVWGREAGKQNFKRNTASFPTQPMKEQKYSSGTSPVLTFPALSNSLGFTELLYSSRVRA